MRKNFLRTFVAAVLICSMLVTPAYAESAKVTGSDVNVRSGPGINYGVVACLPRGAAITVTDSSNSDWYAISYKGITGFMSSRYISISSESSAPSVSEDDGDTNAYINSMYVRFRSGASSNSTVLGEYNTGKQIKVIGSSGGWTQCIINGQTGYVYSDYVTMNGEQPPQREEEEDDGGAVIIIGGNRVDSGDVSGDEDYEQDEQPAPESGKPGGAVIIGGNSDSDEDEEEDEPELTPAPSPTPAPSAKPENSGSNGVVIVGPGSNNAAEEEEDEEEPEVTPTPAPTVSITPTDKQDGYINGDYVRFRKGPATSYSIIATYNRGEELTVLGTSGDWTKCSINGKEGFVFTQYVALNSSSSSTSKGEADKDEDKVIIQTPEEDKTVATDAKSGYITGNNVRLRSKPSTSSQVLGELFYGNSVTITGHSGDWTAVSYNGKNGFVYSSYVKEGEYKYESSGGSASGREIADYALRYVGYKYSWGGKDPSTGFDCSGLMYYVYGQFGYTLNRVAADQARNGVHVDADDIQPGDLLCFYSSGSYIGHVGMYIGDNKFVHAANSATGVVITELSGYYASRGFEARRII